MPGKTNIKEEQSLTIKKKKLQYTAINLASINLHTLPQFNRHIKDDTRRRTSLLVL